VVVGLPSTTEAEAQRERRDEGHTAYVIPVGVAPSSNDEQRRKEMGMKSDGG
jgi:hypothetical protein